MISGRLRFTEGDGERLTVLGPAATDCWDCWVTLPVPCTPVALLLPETDEEALEGVVWWEL